MANETTEKKANLYEIVAQAQVIEQAIAEAGGELSPELEAALAVIDLSLTEKVEGYSHVMDRLDHVSKYWNAKADEYYAIASGLAKAKKRINERLKDGMIALGKDEVMGESIRFKLSPTKGALVISDETKLPDEYLMIETKKVPDKEKIRASLEAFATVPGASLEGGYRMSKYAIKGSK